MNDRFERGWEKLKEIDGEAGEQVVERLKEIAPDWPGIPSNFPSAISTAGPGLT